MPRRSGNPSSGESPPHPELSV
uniref:Uncharacterized protein n=1 Tax=Arundo donax TaxID=35708 RepID=A0A0A9C556_ARUDO